MRPNRDKALLESELGIDPGSARSGARDSRARSLNPESAADIPAEPNEQGQERLLLLLHGQTEVLRLISTRAPLTETLARIATLAEHVIKAALCLIQVLDSDGKKLTQAAAPSLPSGYLHALHQASAANMTSPGGLCLASGKAIYLPEIKVGRRESPENLLDLALSYNLKACWTHPVLGREGVPVGALSIYFRAPRAPQLGDKRIMAALADLARFAIEHDGWAADLRSADQRFASLAANIPGVVYQRRVTPEGQIRYTYISDGAADLFGVTPEEILADPNALFDCHAAQFRETFRERLLKATRELRMWDVEATIVTRDGQRKFTHAIARPHREPDGTVLWDGIILDTTRIKEAELEAAETEARMREAILESISQGLVLYDKDDRLVVCNSHFRNLYPDLADLIRSGVKYETIVRATIDRGLDGQTGDTESDEDLRRQIELRRSREHGTEWHLPDGRWILINENRTADGGTAVIHTDITELKGRAAALERSNQELQDFASIASHDLQEPLRKIEAFGDRLKRKCGDEIGEEGALYLDRIRSSTSRMRELINDLLSYSRVTSKVQPFEACELGQVAAEVVSDLQLQIEQSGGKVEIEDLPVIDADTTQMRQLLQNLISNALKFRCKDSVPLVKVSGRIATPSARRCGAKPVSGEICELSVSDDGIGFDMKYADRIFNIFQRLHGRNEYEGTGIGLATCRKIVERHGGWIFAQSEPGAGTTFTAVLPAKLAAKEMAR